MNSIGLQFIKSWAATDSSVNSTQELFDWINERNRTIRVEINKIPFDENGFWYYDHEKGAIQNRNGSFFSITGIQVTHPESGMVEQPIIIQREIGYLGIICRVIDGVLHCLMQAKIEPGNINKIQISPSIQATKSNFTQLHGGNKPPYLEYFLNATEENIIVDQIQSEQSSRFYKKRNRNIIIMVQEEIEVLPTHRWMTIGQIKALMTIDNLVNMDTRTVLSCIPYSMWRFDIREYQEAEEYFQDKNFFHSIFDTPEENLLPHIYRHLNNFKMFNDTRKELVPLKDLSCWDMENGEFICKDNATFKIIFCDINIEGREVRHWTQPLFEAIGIASFGLIQYNSQGRKLYVISSRPEIGCFDGVELGPTVQEEARTISKGYDIIEQLFWNNVNNNPNCIRHDVLLSEEGGRFYYEQNRNLIIELTEEQIGELPSGYFAVDYNTLNQLVQMNNCLNIQLRNLLALLEV